MTDCGSILPVLSYDSLEIRARSLAMFRSIFSWFGGHPTSNVPENEELQKKGVPVVLIGPSRSVVERVGIQMKPEYEGIQRSLASEDLCRVLTLRVRSGAKFVLYCTSKRGADGVANEWCQARYLW